MTFERDDSLILISTEPLSGDPLLGPLAWRGAFLQNLLGAIYMRKGEATFHGLPEGNLYIYALFNDRTFALGTMQVRAKAAASVEAPISAISPWKGTVKLPDELSPLAAEMKKNPAAFEARLRQALGADFARPNDLRNYFDIPLDRSFLTPGGIKTTVGDVITVQEYENFNRQAQEIAQRKKPSSRPLVK